MRKKMEMNTRFYNEDGSRSYTILATQWRRCNLNVPRGDTLERAVQIRVLGYLSKLYLKSAEADVVLETGEVKTFKITL